MYLTPNNMNASCATTGSDIISCQRFESITYINFNAASSFILLRWLCSSCDAHFLLQRESFCNWTCRANRHGADDTGDGGAAHLTLLTVFRYLQAPPSRLIGQSCARTPTSLTSQTTLGDKVYVYLSRTTRCGLFMTRSTMIYIYML